MLNRKTLALAGLMIFGLIYGGWGCDTEKPTEDIFGQGDTLTGSWQGSYSVITNPGGVDSRDSMHVSIIGYNDFFLATITLGVGSDNPEVLTDTAIFSDTSITIGGTGIIMGDPQTYSFVGSLEGSIFRGTVRFVNQTKGKYSDGNFVARR